MHGAAREAKLQALISDHSEGRERVGELTRTFSVLPIQLSKSWKTCESRDKKTD